MTPEQRAALKRIKDPANLDYLCDLQEASEWLIPLLERQSNDLDGIKTVLRVQTGTAVDAIEALSRLEQTIESLRMEFCTCYLLSPFEQHCKACRSSRGEA